MSSPRFAGAYHQAANWLYQLAQSHNGSNLWVDINDAPVLLIQRLAEADHVLRLNAANYRKNMHWFRHMLGPSRFSEDGPAWDIRRDLTQHYLAKFDRERTFNLACAQAANTVRELAGHSADGADHLSELCLRRLAMSVLVENFFDVPLNDTGVDLEHLASLMEFGSEYAFTPSVGKDILQHQRLHLLPALRRQIFNDFRLFRSNSLPPSPLLKGLLAADHDPSNNIQLEHELLTFFSAGADTTAAAVGWGCYLLALYPELQQQLREAVLPFWTSGDLSWKRLSQIELLEAFVSETLRLFPPTPIVTRLANSEDEIDGHHIGPDCNVSVSIIGIQHDALRHPDPWRPHLERYRNNACAGANVGFIFGPRVCGGKKFALIELATFMAVFLRDAELTLLSTDQPRFYWKSLMLREGGQPVHISLRH
ncbi:cytochrome P450 [Pseudomonas sp. TTU2014-080ASC]|uniref:cytochrome P450 n=1 Tax=Pseudomonas sp. TTU2014-080ASC TaxID=1729724 RepID=UPI00071847EA|nr:cytochrome P450 [Pseudomonas sp. TTU2014-080ASC]KRW59834.1 monooxygenase [Pseudomonas sp. TTU2014-080ASC]